MTQIARTVARWAELRAGSITLEGLTANLGVARELTEQVQRLLAGYEEVDRTLKA